MIAENYNFPRTTRKKLDLFFYAAISYPLIVLYIIPYGLIPHFRIFLPLLVAIFGLEVLLVKHKKDHWFDWLLSIGIVSTGIIRFYYTSTETGIQGLGMALLISMLLLNCRQEKRINKFFARLMYYPALVSIILQLRASYQNNYGTGEERLVLGVSDTEANLSSLFILIFFFFCLKNNFKIGSIFCLLCSLLFVSRGYALALLVFFLTWVWEKKLFKYLSKINFATLFIGVNIFLIILSIFWVNNINPTLVEGQVTGVERLATINDNSNYVRFALNQDIINLFMNDLELAAWGFPGDYAEAITKTIGKPPHNSLLSFVATNGVLLSILYFWIFIKIVTRFYTQQNLKYILSYLAFALVLYGAFNPVTGVGFVAMLSLAESKNKLKFKL
ncbi:MAG: hypothetical protein DSM107014_03545 [Gomphosphaeria aponina SAG 52.96 = DSM 107014]|uniref:Uncharacterized protein n=1 Tax=Gomphosphaeria aponina SAG 52.96 = DSM 107014 TaxID=1521640 RepID=A0A941GWZ1_9CHRO|nr:hypothetical protein [Gomphosphaeria aponina SAG 52.96 = DSM 107014]